MTFDSKTLLIGIGAQKAGTTWLSRYLAGHPEVFIVPIKELHYFDRKYAHFRGREKKLQVMAERIEADEACGRNQKRLERLAHFGLEEIADEASYVEFFRRRVSKQKVFGEFTPTYAMLDAAAFAIMNRVHPEVRFVFILRDPIDRAWSQFCFARRSQPHLLTGTNFVQALNHPQLILRSDYKRTIEELDKAVPHDRIKLAFYESMFSEPSMREITDFLRIGPWPAQFERKKLSSKPELDPKLARLAFARFRHVYDFIAEKFGENLPMRWRETMEQYHRVDGSSIPARVKGLPRRLSAFAHIIKYRTR